MTAIEKAQWLYASNGEDFSADLQRHLKEGIVISSPLWFIMLRAVKLDDGRMAWYINCAVGNLKDLAELISVRLPYVAFCRMKRGQKTQRVYRTDRLLALAQREITIKS